MPTVFYSDAASFFDDVTPEALRYAQATARPFGLEVGIIPLASDPADRDAPLAMLLRLQPGQVLRRHSHACFRVEVLVQGTLDVGNGRILRPGDVATSAPGEAYGPHVAGPEGSLSVEIFSSARGILPDYDDGGASGPVRDALLEAIEERRA
jgi:hypothetical protein